MWKTLLAQFFDPSCDIMSHNWDFLVTVKSGSLNLKSGSSLDEDNFYCANIISMSYLENFLSAVIIGIFSICACAIRSLSNGSLW